MSACVNRWRHDDDNWQHLDGFFKPVVLRFFISWFAAAPILATILEDYRWFIELPFTWWILWIASVSYSASFILHRLYCPEFVKRYPHSGKYEERGHSPRYIVWQCYHYLSAGGNSNQSLKLRRRLVEKGFAQYLREREIENDSEFPSKPEVGETGTSIKFELDGKVYVLSMNENESQAKVRDIFWEVFARWAKQSGIARSITWALLFASMILVFITVVQNVISVIQIAIR